jgi:hypothetical protein
MDIMKDDNTNIVVMALGVLISILSAMIISQLMIKDSLSKYEHLEDRVIKLEDSLRVQHNYYQFTIEKDTIINKTIKIQCVK